MPRTSARAGGRGRAEADGCGRAAWRLREDTRPRGDRPRLLDAPAGARDRSHRLQGRVAVAVAAVAGRRGDRPGPGRADATRRCTSWPASARTCASTPSTCATRTRCARRCARRAPRSCCTWRPSRWSGARCAIPAMTYEVNVMGTVNVLEAVRAGRRTRCARWWWSPRTSATRIPAGGSRRFVEERSARRDGSLLELEGVRRARRRRLPALVLLRGGLAAARRPRARAT